MKYINSIYTTNMSGKQGNVIFSRNKYGPFSCLRKVPTNPNTPAQQMVRSGTKNIALQWERLTPLQREGWNREASKHLFHKKDKSYCLTGFMFFMKLNRNLYEIGIPINLDVPVGSGNNALEVGSFSVNMIDNTSGKDYLLFFDPPIDSRNKLIVYATKSIKVTEQYMTHVPFKIAVLDSTFLSGSSIKDYFLRKYKSLPDSGSKVFFKIKFTNISSGFTSVAKSCETYGI
jgi:hypothetical protein